MNMNVLNSIDKIGLVKTFKRALMVSTFIILLFGSCQTVKIFTNKVIHKGEAVIQKHGFEGFEIELDKKLSDDFIDGLKEIF